MDPLLTYRLAFVVIIAFIYMLFDVFNKRNVPAIYAYLTLGIGIIFTLFYLNSPTILLSGLIALIVGGFGFVFYRAGQLGGADVIEMTVISLILTLQPQPYLIFTPQYNLPFIISVFMASGVAALLLVPLYYLPRADKILKGKLKAMVTAKDLFKGVITTIAYMAFMTFIALYMSISTAGLILLATMLVGSFVTITFEKPITDSMVEFIKVDKFEEGDIIATNLMSKGEISAAKKRIKGFDRLVTQKLIKEIRRKDSKRKFPVYRNAMPLALPIFVGVITSLLFGNIVLLIL
ncbi:MAG: hypothetical protein M1504_00365 [Candidatus Marsarchaeota archaeon]|nr:hypothetical protein [Candidatus Marsarchaeota archaeon]